MKSATFKLAEILRVLGSEDAINILRFAKSGFEGTTDVHKRLGLSAKRYYSRLGKLMDAGIIVKTDNRYEATSLGLMLCDYLERNFLWAIENIDQLRVLDTLKRSKTIDDETLEKVADILDTKPNVIQTYEKLVDATVHLTETAEEKICLATRFSDIKYIDAACEAATRGIHMRVLSADTGELGRLKTIGVVLTHPRRIKQIYQFLHSDQCSFRYGTVPFSFIVVDHRACCFEVMNPAPGYSGDFFAAVLFDNNENLSKKLIKSFDHLWQAAVEDPAKDLLQDLIRQLERKRILNVTSNRILNLNQ